MTAVTVTLNDRTPLPSVGLVCECGKPFVSIEGIARACTCGRVWIISATLVSGGSR